jgi:hypothetical protein
MGRRFVPFLLVLAVCAAIVVERADSAPTKTCEAGYSPCLPRVADLNCGDIAESKKPIRVTGPDPYRLDGDGDGWGCEP